MGLSLGKLQRQWLIGFLLVSLLFPIMLATLLLGIGRLAGCQMVGEAAEICLVRGINIGDSIKSLVDWTWYVPALSLFQVPILSIGLLIGLLGLIYKSFHGLTRIFVGIFSIWYLWFAPPIVGIIFVVYVAGQAQCSINEGGVGACYLFGLDMGNTFHTVATIPWLLFILFPLCAVASVIYIVMALLNPSKRSPK